MLIPVPWFAPVLMKPSKKCCGTCAQFTIIECIILMVYYNTCMQLDETLSMFHCYSLLQSLGLFRYMQILLQWLAILAPNFAASTGGMGPRIQTM